MYLEFIEEKHPDAVTYLVSNLGSKTGSDRFILAARDGLGLSGEKLVWWIGLFDRYHKHSDYSYPNILRTRKHFKNIAFTYLDNGDYKMFNTWIKNWSDLLVVCRHAYPEKWTIKSLEDTK